MPEARTVHLLDADPDLLEGLDESSAVEARSSVVAPVRTVARGEWSPTGDEFGSRSGYGLFILEGFLTRRVALGERAGAELLGEGDVLHPWLDDGEFAVLPFEASFTVLERLHVAVLERRVAEELSRWPDVVRNLMTRVARRSRYLAGHLTLTQFPRIETRLLVLFWHLAERYGRVTPEGVVLRLPLSHDLLGRLISARRPSVTTALRQLEEAQSVVPRGRQEWLLLGERPQELEIFPSGAPDP